MVWCLISVRSRDYGREVLDFERVVGWVAGRCRLVGIAVIIASVDGVQQTGNVERQLGLR